MRTRFFIFLGIVFALFAIPRDSSALTLEEAYKAIPHQQTTYQKDRSKLPAETSADLEEFFHLVDLAIVSRVEALQILRTSRGRVEKQITDLKRLAQRLKQFKLPSESAEVARLVGNATMDQANYLQSVSKANRLDVQQLSGDLRVQSASEKLKQAYAALIQIYPQEGKENKQAFYDHLCALDFL